MNPRHPRNPRLILREIAEKLDNQPHVQTARSIISQYFAPTRLVRAEWLSVRYRAGVYLKLESELPTGSFKPRGALVALAAQQTRGSIREVIAASTGNHGAAVAYAAKLLGIPARVFLPQHANAIKRDRILSLGATLEETGADISDAIARAAEYATRDGIYFLHDATDPNVPLGTATIAIEILEQLPDADTIYVPMGDTALIRGIAYAAKHLRAECKIIGVQTERAPSYYLSWREGKVVETSACDTIADGLATRRPIAENVTSIRELVDQIYLVSEDEMLASIRDLLLHEHVVAEPAGAAALAGFAQGANPRTNEKIVLIVSGANVTSEVLRRALAV